jgi:hypothetical protein
VRAASVDTCRQRVVVNREYSEAQVLADAWSDGTDSWSERVVVTLKVTRQTADTISAGTCLVEEHSLGSVLATLRHDRRSQSTSCIRTRIAE